MTSCYRLAAAAAMVLTATTGVARADTLTVKVEGLRSKTGRVLIALHDNAASFPSDWSAAIRLARVPVGRGAAPRAVFKNVPKGRYAAIVVHDEDGDGAMSKTFIGYPREGFGSSNNPSAFGPPRFRAARFELDGDQTLTIRLTYL